MFTIANQQQAVRLNQPDSPNDIHLKSMQENQLCKLVSAFTVEIWIPMSQLIFKLKA